MSENEGLILAKAKSVKIDKPVSSQGDVPDEIYYKDNGPCKKMLKGNRSDDAQKTFCASVISRDKKKSYSDSKRRYSKSSVHRLINRRRYSLNREFEYFFQQNGILPYYQDVEIPPVDPLLLQQIDSDEDGLVQVAGVAKVVRFYGESAVVLLDWDDPRDIAFQPGSRRLIIDDMDMMALAFNEPYNAFKLKNGSVVRIRFGAPTRDLYVDGRPYSAVFGGPPIEVFVGNTSHRFQLGGPPPHMFIGNIKRTDLVAGRINLSINNNMDTVFPIYLDSKPQKFYINGTPFTFKFDATLESALINGKPFAVTFGDVSIPINVFGEVHFLMLSPLPPGVYQGHTNFVDVENRCNVMPNTQIPLMQVPLIQPDSHNFHYHYHYHVPHLEVDQNMKTSQSVVPPRVEVPQKVEYTVLIDPPTLATESIDVQDLFRKLVENGIVRPSSSERNDIYSKEKVEKEIKVSFKKVETLRSKNWKAIGLLYVGVQCLSCGLRFMDSEQEYDTHVESHMFNNDLGNRMKWWCHHSEFLAERGNEEIADWFGRNGYYRDVSRLSGEEVSELAMLESSQEHFGNTSDTEDLDSSPNPPAAVCVKANRDISSNEAVQETNVDTMSLMEVPCDDSPIEINSEEELYGDMAVFEEPPSEGESDCDILEVVELQPTFETVELSDYELEEGEIIEGPEEEKRLDSGMYSLSRVKKEKSPDTRRDVVGLDGDAEYRSARLNMPKKIKVNISSVLPPYHHGRTLRKNLTAVDLEDISDDDDISPASVKEKIARANISIHTTRLVGTEKSALCSIM